MLECSFLCLVTVLEIQNGCSLVHLVQARLLASENMRREQRSVNTGGARQARSTSYSCGSNVSIGSDGPGDGGSNRAEVAHTRRFPWRVSPARTAFAHRPV